MTNKGPEGNHTNVIARHPLAYFNRQAEEPLRAFLDAQRTTLDRFERQQPQDDYGLPQALRARDGRQIMEALFNASQDHEYMRRIAKSTWTEIIRSFDPRKSIPPLHSVHRSLNPRQLAQIGFDPLKSTRAAMEMLISVANIRREHGIRMGIADYQLLLQHAARIGNRRAAMGLWSDMKRDGVAPNVLCYNAYMEAIVWDEESRLLQQKRAKGNWSRILDRPTNIMFFKPGTSSAVTEIFDEMAARKIVGNTATFCVLMTALARDGSIDDAVGVVSYVWGVDVQRLMREEEAMGLPKKLPNHSPMYPNTRLLSTIAEIFGAADRVPTALRLIDFFSQHYSIVVSKNVWYQISKWTWLQARANTTRRVRAGRSQSELTAVQRLSETLTSEPYNISPTMEHRHVMFKSAGATTGDDDTRPRLLRMLRLLESGRRDYVLQIKTYREARHLYRNAISHPLTSTHSRNASRLRERVEQAQLNKKRTHQLLQRWTRIMIGLHGLRFAPGPQAMELRAWRLRGMPNFLSQYQSFVPSIIWYRTDTGVVNMTFRTVEEVQANKARKEVVGERRHFNWLDLSRVGKPWSGARWKGRRSARTLGQASPFQEVPFQDGAPSQKAPPKSSPGHLESPFED